jgi:hypothetical protein
MPVPLRGTVCVTPTVPLLLSVTVSVPVFAPGDPGLNVTLIVQLVPAARVPAPAGQVPPDLAKLADAAIAVISKSPPPEFDSVTV